MVRTHTHMYIHTYAHIHVLHIYMVFNLINFITRDLSDKKILPLVLGCGRVSCG